MTIVRRIIAGEFDNEPYLPSIPKLMEEYNITKTLQDGRLACSIHWDRTDN